MRVLINISKILEKDFYFMIEKLQDLNFLRNTKWLIMGANVIGYAFESYTSKDNFVVTGLKNKITHIIGDVRNYKKLKEIFTKYQPEFVFHLAVQSIARKSYLNPKEI